jgi:short-subunit dehydrogenase
MKVEIVGTNLVITAPLGKLEPSKSGKSLNVVSTGGFIPTTASIDGKPIRVNVNAIVGR